MVQGGLGVALLPSEEFSVRPLSSVKELKLKERIIKEVGIVWRRDLASPLVDTVVQFARQWVQCPPSRWRPEGARIFRH